MSADNWARCPRCVARDRESIDELTASTAMAYGEVAVAEFDRMREELARRRTQHEDYNAFRTFREDYEVFGAEDGLVEVRYSGKCLLCGLSLAFTHAHQLDAEVRP